MNEEICLIPRNLRKLDNIIQTPKLNIKQLTYIGLGIGGAYIAFSSGMLVIYKVITIVGSLAIGLAGSFYKYRDSSLDELAIDGIVYLQRKNYYHQLNKRSGLIVNISARAETTTTKKTSFNI